MRLLQCSGGEAALSYDCSVGTQQAALGSYPARAIDPPPRNFCSSMVFRTANRTNHTQGSFREPPAAY
jgi:hypothetical protein